MLAFILAVGDGLPHLAPELIDMLIQTINQDTLKMAFDHHSFTKSDYEHAILSKWLESNVDFGNTPACSFHDIISIVERFLFRTGVNLRR